MTTKVALLTRCKAFSGIDIHITGKTGHKTPKHGVGAENVT